MQWLDDRRARRDRSPAATQRLLNQARWDTAGAMSVVRRFAVARLDAAAAPASLTVGTLDESGQEKKGSATSGVKRQHMGCAGGVDNGVNTVYLAYVRAGSGHALIGARQWIPAEQITSPVTAVTTGLPLDLVFATKGELGVSLLSDAHADGVRFERESFSVQYVLLMGVWLLLDVCHLLNKDFQPCITWLLFYLFRPISVAEERSASPLFRCGCSCRSRVPSRPLWVAGQWYQGGAVSPIETEGEVRPPECRYRLIMLPQGVPGSVRFCRLRRAQDRDPADPFPPENSERSPRLRQWRAVETVDARARLRRPFVVVRAYLDAARHLVPLVTPAAVVFLPLALIAVSALLPPLGGSAVVRNAELEIYAAEPGHLLIWSAAVLVVFTVAQAVVFPATVVIAAGLQAGGPPVPARRALRVALRRLPSMVLLVALAVPVFALVVAAGFGALLVTGSLVPAVFVFVGLALFTMPALLAVPAIVLEGRSAPRAVARGYDLVIGYAPSSAFTLACGMYVIPGIVSAARDAAMAGLHGPALMYASGLAGGVLALAGTAFQASVVTRQFLHRLSLRPDPVSAEELDRILAGLPGTGPRRRVRFPLVLPVLLLPGLVYGGVATANPFGWLETSETDVTAAWRESFDDGEGAPVLRRGDLRALYPGPGTGMVALVYGGFQKPSAIFACADHTCRRARLRYAAAGPDQDLRIEAVGAALPDGRLVLTSWTWHRGEWESWESLGLLICDQEGCLPPREGSPLIPRHDFGFGVSLALSARPGGGLVLAAAEPVELEQGLRQYDDVISLISCADPLCSRPVTREVARVPSGGFGPEPQTLSVAVGADGRPVVARMDSRTGAVHVVSCEDPACARPHVTRPVAPQTIELTDDTPRHAVALAVRPDGRPVLAYQDIRDSAVKYVDCRTRDCARHVTVALSGESYAPPVPVIDRAGRVLVAYQDAGRPYVMLATCADGRCTRTAVTGVRNGPGDGLAMALDRAGRPVIVWTDDNGSYFSDSKWSLMTTTPLNLTP